MSTFQSLGVLAPSLVTAVSDGFGFQTMTPVQQASIPRLLSHQDVAVEACTGSGKTLAFLLPCFQLILNQCSSSKTDDGFSESQRFKGIGALVLSPTRELASQICTVAKELSSRIKVECELFTGGRSLDDDLRAIVALKTNIVIGTPGRICDLLERTSVCLKKLEVLILDEADVLLDAGFEKAVTAILHAMPKQRRTGLFSATQTKKVKALIRAGLRNPAIISVQVESKMKEDTKQCTPSALKNFYTLCDSDEKLGTLVRFAMQHKEEKLIVFFSTCACVDFFFKLLTLLPEMKESQVHSLHGRMKQSKRVKAYKTFASSERGLLLCTDVAARGIDIPDVDWIVQFHPPQDPSFFVHRVGRTARAGRQGNALVFLLPNEEAYIPFLKGRQVPIGELEVEKHTEADQKLLDYLIKEQYNDRDILEKGTRAFISHIRSYNEHHCGFIFRTSELNLCKLAKSFLLLRLPKLAELRESKGLKDFKQVPIKVVQGIKFKDRVREKHRQQQFKKKGQLEQKSEAESKQEKRKKVVADPEIVSQRRKKKKGKQQRIFEEWDELAREERLHKKFKKGSISKEKYEQLLLSFGTT